MCIKHLFISRLSRLSRFWAAAQCAAAQALSFYVSFDSNTGTAWSKFSDFLDPAFILRYNAGDKLAGSTDYIIKE